MRISTTILDDCYYLTGFPKKKGSKNREKARLQVAKLHEKIANQRNDFLHKISNEVTNENPSDCD